MSARSDTRASRSPSSRSRCQTAVPRLATPLSASYLLSDPHRGARPRVGEPLFNRSHTYGHAKSYYNPARNTICARFSTTEWQSSNDTTFSRSDNENSSSERFRANMWRALKDLDAKTRNRQDETTRKLSERAQELNMWKTELNSEIEAMQTETANLKEYRRVLEKAYMDSANPLHIAEECLIARERRQGIDRVHDCVEKALIKEVNLIKRYQDKMKKLLQKTSIQLKMSRAAQDACEGDSKDKNQAQNTDEKMQQLRNSSGEIGFFPGIEAQDNTVSVPESWLQYTQDNILRSQTERASSERLRSEIENCLRAASNNLWSMFNNVNNNLKARIRETTDTRNKLQSRLQQTMQEIYDLDKQLQLIRKTLIEMEKPLKVSQTRLQERTTRPNVESCHDYAMSTLQKEVQELKESMRYLRDRQRMAEAGMARLMKNKAMLDTDIAVKNNSLYIDQNMCLGMRNSMPTDSRVGPIFQMPSSK